MSPGEAWSGTYLNRLQAAVAQWHDANWTQFGTDQMARRLAKLTEEVGEVAECVIKIPEGRRTRAQLADELGDAVIVLCALADAADVDLDTAVRQRWNNDVRHRTAPIKAVQS